MSGGVSLSGGVQHVCGDAGMLQTRASRRVITLCDLAISVVIFAYLHDM